MTEYEATQRQRYIERQIRRYKREVAGLDAAGIDCTDSRNQLAKWQKRQADFIDQTGLKRDYSREVVEGYSPNTNKTEKSALNAKKTVAKGEKSGIISTGSGNMTIHSIEKPIEFPIEQRNTGKGNPNAIVTFGIELNNRQKELLEMLPDFDSSAIVSKKSVNMSDLSAFTAHTGDEFAMFTKGNERLIIRGNSQMVQIDIEKAKELSEHGYKWSGHTHPGFDFISMQPSDGDYSILDCFKQNSSVIYNSKGEFRTFEKRS